MTTFQEVFETVKFANPWAALWFPVFLMVVDFATGTPPFSIRQTGVGMEVRVVVL